MRQHVKHGQLGQPCHAAHKQHKQRDKNVPHLAEPLKILVLRIDAAHDLHKNQHRQRQRAEDQVALLAAPAVYLAAGAPVDGHGIRQGRVDRQMADDIQNTNNQQYPEQRAQFIIFHHRFLL